MKILNKFNRWFYRTAGYLRLLRRDTAHMVQGQEWIMIFNNNMNAWGFQEKRHWPTEFLTFNKIRPGSNSARDAYEALPMWQKHLFLYDYETHSIKGPSYVARFWIRKAWFAIPLAIRDYNIRDCVHYIPDWVSPTKGEGMGTKVRPFMGRVLILDQGATHSYAWWKNLKRYSHE